MHGRLLTLSALVASQVRVLDPFAGKEVETMDLSKLGCHSHEGLFSGFGLQTASFHNSVCGHDNLLYFLGRHAKRFIMIDKIGAGGLRC